ncbi:bifunctional riboflavin kinase/FAD synthetase [Chloroflexota bacterium]
MQVEEELARLSPGKDILLTIGVFDGVHLGHKRLISRLMEEAKRRGLFSGVITFHQHPEEVISPERGLPFITSVKERARLLKNEGVSAIIILSFTRELANLSARQFVKLLKKHLGMRGLVLGPDFKLGRGRSGDIESLNALGREMGFTVDVVPPVKINGEVVSSTGIRNVLGKGNMGKIQELLGRSFSLSGCVVNGSGRGTELGFPTANLDIPVGQALPADGVYAAWVDFSGKIYRAMVNIGQNPTFDAGKHTVEVYILDYHGDLYGKELKIDIIKRLRGEKTFSNAGKLQKQIEKDIEQGKAILKSARGK